MAASKLKPLYHSWGTVALECRNVVANVAHAQQAIETIFNKSDQQGNIIALLSHFINYMIYK